MSMIFEHIEYPFVKGYLGGIIDIEDQRSQIILEFPRRTWLVKWVKLGVNHGLSCCNKEIIKNKLVATRSGEFNICSKVG